MSLRSAVLINMCLALIVFVLLTGEAYMLFLKHKFWGNRVAVGGICKQDGLSKTGSKEAFHKDVYVNCSGFQS